MSEIADAIVHSTGGTTRLIDRMVSEGLLERRACPTDRRAIHVEITDRGNHQLDKALAIHVDRLGQLFDRHLSVAEQAQLASLLLKLR